MSCSIAVSSSSLGSSRMRAGIAGVDGQFSRKSLPRSCTIHHGNGGRRRQSSQWSFQLWSGRSDQYTRIVLAPQPSAPGQPAQTSRKIVGTAVSGESGSPVVRS